MKTILYTAAAVSLAACAANGQPAAQILDGQWRVVELAAAALPADVRAELGFHAAESRFSGYAGCNRMMGGYENHGASLKFSAVASTRMLCEPELMKREQAMTDALGKTAAYSVNRDGLVLKDASGATLLKAVRMGAE